MSFIDELRKATKEAIIRQATQKKQMEEIEAEEHKNRFNNAWHRLVAKMDWEARRGRTYLVYPLGDQSTDNKDYQESNLGEIPTYLLSESRRQGFAAQLVLEEKYDQDGLYDLFLRISW